MGSKSWLALAFGAALALAFDLAFPLAFALAFHDGAMTQAHVALEFKHDLTMRGWKIQWLTYENSTRTLTKNKGLDGWYDMIQWFDTNTTNV